MRTSVLCAVLGLLAVAILPACDGASGLGEATSNSLDETAERTGGEGQQPARTTDEPAETPPENAPSLGERVARGRDAIGDTVASTSERANEWFADLGASPLRGWIFVAVALGFGVVMMLYGWALVKSFMIPFAPVWGLVLGGFTAFSLIKVFQGGEDWQLWHRLVLMGGGALFGVGVFMFAALKAKPVAALLVVVSPFLIAATFISNTNVQVAIIVFFIGFVAGFAAMIQVRPIAVISTSLFGALSLFAAYGVTAYLLQAPAEGEAGGAMVSSIGWLLDTPWILLLVLATVTFLGCNFQFATGPRGTLED